MIAENRRDRTVEMFSYRSVEPSVMLKISENSSIVTAQNERIDLLCELCDLLLFLLRKFFMPQIVHMQVCKECDSHACESAGGFINPVNFLASEAKIRLVLSWKRKARLRK